MPEVKNEPWFKAADPGEAIATSIIDLASHSDANRRRKLMAWRALYLDLPYEYYGDSNVGVWRKRGRSRYNLTQGAVDATRSRICATRPRPQVLTVAGNFKLQRKARLLQRWLDGEYERIKAYDLLSSAVLDALIYGTAAIKVTPDWSKNKCRAEKVWAGDLFVDPREERFGSVRSLYHISGGDRDVLAAEWPDNAAQIMKQKTTSFDDSLFPDMHTKRQLSHNIVTVVEAWRLPAGPDSPGRHVICVGKETVLDEEWTYSDFPFVFLHWADDPNRFWGQGMVERGSGIQSDLNNHSSIVQEAYDTYVPKYAVPRGANVKVETLNDEVGQVLFFDGPVAPTVLAPPPISSDFLTREDMIAERYYKVCGVSELSAASVKPAGINSGKGMLVYQDTETQRFLVQGRAYERASIDLANLLIYTARLIAEEGEPEALKVYGGTNGLEIAEFDKAMFKDDEDEVYHLRTWPVSVLSNSISGKLDEVERIVQLAGLQDPDQIRELLDIPDIERYQDLQSAKRYAVNKEIDRCLDGEQGVPSSEWGLDGLEYALQRSLSELYNAALGGADEDILQLVRNFSGAARTWLERLSVEVQPPVEDEMMEPPPGAGEPMMPPGAPPTPPMGMM